MCHRCHAGLEAGAAPQPGQISSAQATALLDAALLSHDGNAHPYLWMMVRCVIGYTQLRSKEWCTRAPPASNM